MSARRRGHLGEPARPIPAGSGEGDSQGERPEATAAWVWFTVACVVLAGWFLLLWGVAGLHSEKLAIAVAVTLVYLALGYCVHLEPDYRYDDGLAGVPLINKPFDWTDNINRMQIYLNGLLWPGRFLAESLVGPLVVRSADQQFLRKREAERREATLDDQLKVFLSAPKPVDQQGADES